MPNILNIYWTIWLLLLLLIWLWLLLIIWYVYLSMGTGILSLHVEVKGQLWGVHALLLQWVLRTNLRSFGLYSTLVTFYCGDKPMPTSSLGREGVMWFTHWYQSTSLWEDKAGTWRQKLKQRPWRSAAYWLANHDLHSLLSLYKQHHQLKGSIIHSGLGH